MKKRPLDIWVRAWGSFLKDHLEEFLENLARITPDYEPQLIIFTEDDKITTFLDKINSTIKENIKVIYGDIHSFSEAINALIQESVGNLSLSISVGIELTKEQLVSAEASIDQGAYAYGWEVKDYLNDGSEIHKLWYNTAVMLSPKFVDLLFKHPLPKWVDNYNQGVLEIGDKEIPIGGLEELYMMEVALKENEDSIFLIDRTSPLPNSIHAATDLNFEDKILRKSKVAKYYLEHNLTITEKILLNSNKIVNMSF